MITDKKMKKYQIELSQDDIQFLLDLLSFPKEVSEGFDNESIKLQFSQNPTKLFDEIYNQTHDEHGAWIGDLYSSGVPICKSEH